jgi:hypothetical protein
MATQIKRVSYFHAVVKDRPGEAYALLAQLAQSQVKLLAFNAVPAGIETTQLVIFPQSAEQLIQVADRTGLLLTGPQRALLIQGDDELGALAEIHRQLSEAAVNVYASSGVTDGRGGYGYVIYVRDEDFERAASILGV